MAPGAAVEHLRAASEFDPGSYGTFEKRVGRDIDRDVRFIDGGVDAQYLEHTAAGCWDWARSVGSEFEPRS